MGYFRPKTFLGAIIIAGVIASSAVPALAFGETEISTTVPGQGTVEVKYSNGRTEVSAPLWSGNIPSRVRAIAKESYSTCYELKFPIQALLQYSEIVNASSSVDIDFELWTVGGEKIGTKSVYSSTWNPLGGPTVVAWSECDTWNVPGSYNLLITTEQTLSTTGLLSRYVKGLQVVPFIVDPPRTKELSVKCKKGKQIKTYKRAKCPAGWRAA